MKIDSAIVLRNIEIRNYEISQLYQLFSNRGVVFNTTQNHEEQEEKQDEETSAFLNTEIIHNGMKKQAILSQDGKYRYQLSRIWDEEKPKLLFIMHNPSTADAIVDDATTNKVINYVKKWGYGGDYVGNLYADRIKDPKTINERNYQKDEINIQHISCLIRLVDKVIYCWGFNKKEPEWLINLVDTPYCIDVSTKGLPKHPLYLKKDLQYQLYSRDS